MITSVQENGFVVVVVGLNSVTTRSEGTKTELGGGGAGVVGMHRSGG